jgi:DNA-binding NarL/FixJ family response regulator
MIPTGKILIIDDDPLFTGAYLDILSRDGYEVSAASTDAEARAQLAGGTWDVVLLDRKMQGAHGPDTGLDLLQEIKAVSPATRTIVVTGFADKDTVVRAFADGAYDYLEKRETLETLLKVKVRNAIEAIRERRIAAMLNGKRDANIRELWDATKREKDKNRKGALLEDLLAFIFKSIRGFEQTTTNRKSADEEIDLVVRNESADPFWTKQGGYLLGECKNWSSTVDRSEFDAFRAKIQRRRGQSHLGFFISINGFTSGFRSANDAARESGTLIIAIDGGALAELVETSDRNAKLKNLCDAAIL